MQQILDRQAAKASSPPFTYESPEKMEVKRVNAECSAISQPWQPNCIGNSKKDDRKTVKLGAAEQMHHSHFPARSAI